jgi:hypothetical protein
LLYAIAVVAFAVVMIYKVAPVHGKKNALIYLSICSTVGSISVMSVKAFGIALKLTFAGSNQFSHPSTYVFMILTTVCILTQMNYFNKALASFPSNMYDYILCLPCLSQRILITKFAVSTPCTMLPSQLRLSAHLSSSSRDLTPTIPLTRYLYSAASWSPLLECTCSTCPGEILPDES